MVAGLVGFRVQGFRFSRVEGHSLLRVLLRQLKQSICITKVWGLGFRAYGQCRAGSLPYAASHAPSSLVSRLIECDMRQVWVRCFWRN